VNGNRKPMNIISC